MGTKRRAGAPRGESRWGWFAWLLGAAAFATVIGAALHYSEAADFVRLVDQARPAWMAAAVALQVATYLAQGRVFGVVARAGNVRLAPGAAFRLSLAKLFVEQALPSAGVSGSVAAANWLQGFGMSRALVASAVLIDLISYYAAYAMCLVAALVLAARAHELDSLVLWVSLAFATYAVAIGAALLWFVGAPAPRW